MRLCVNYLTPPSLIKIPRNTIIATIEPISADECLLFYADNDKDVISSVTDSDCELHTTQNTTPDRSEVRKNLSELGVKIGDGHLTAEEKEEVENLIAENADLFAKDLKDLPEAKLEKFKIDTGSSPPVRQRAYRQSPQAKREIER